MGQKVQFMVLQELKTCLNLPFWVSASLKVNVFFHNNNLHFKIYSTRISLYPGVPDAPYWVISTDYQSYALVYSCSDFFGLFRVEFAWILARTRVLADNIISQLHDKLAADAGIDLSRLTVTNQTGCDVM